MAGGAGHPSAPAQVSTPCALHPRSPSEQGWTTARLVHSKGLQRKAGPKDTQAGVSDGVAVGGPPPPSPAPLPVERTPPTSIQGPHSPINTPEPRI